MRENLYYLFVSGLILGSGPCISFCAPILASYVVMHKATVAKSLGFYFLFSLGKLLSYIILGVICALISGILHSLGFSQYLNFINIALGAFIVLLGISVFFSKEFFNEKYCLILNKKSVTNACFLGILVGLAPCLPLFGILNYIVIISKSFFDAIVYSFVFGLGTVISPLIVITVLSAKLQEVFFISQKVKLLLRFICALLLIFLGLNIILQKLAR